MAAASSRQPVVVGPALIPLGDYASTPPIPLSRPVIVVGSRSNCRIHLISSTVSKAHCLLVLTETGCYVADLASRTKTLVNGQPVRERDLQDGDTLQVGRFPFRFVAGRTRATGRFPPAPPASLVNEDAPLPVPIERRVTLIGRRSTADIPLLEESVSTAHAVILERDGKRYLRDLGSRTGTFLNGRKIHQEELRPGDVIRVGETELRYQLEEVATVEPSEEPEAVAPTRVRPATPLASAATGITSGVVESAPVEETVTTPVEDELPLHIEPEPAASEPVEPPQTPPAHDPSAETAIPMSVEEHDESAVIELEPSSPPTVGSSATTATLTPESPSIEPVPDASAGRGSEASGTSVVESEAAELSPRRGWRSAAEPVISDAGAEERRDEGTDGAGGQGTEGVREEGTEGRRDEGSEGGEIVGFARDDRREQVASLVDQPESRLPAHREVTAPGEPAVVEEPLQPIELPPLRFTDEPVDRPIAAAESLVAEESPGSRELPVEEQAVAAEPETREVTSLEPIAETEPTVREQSSDQARTDEPAAGEPSIAESFTTPPPATVESPEMSPVAGERAAEPQPAEAVTPLPEIDLSRFMPTPGRAAEEADADEPPPPPAALLSLEAAKVEPTAVVPPTIAALDSGGEVIEPTEPEPESALPTVEPPVELSPPEVAEPLSDSVFARQVEAFAGEGGDVVAEPEATAWQRDGGTGGVREEGTEGGRDRGTEGRTDEGGEGRRDGGTEGQRDEGPIAFVGSESESPPDVVEPTSSPTEPVALPGTIPTPLDTISAEDEALLAERLPETPTTADAPSSSPVEVLPLPSVDVFSWSADQAAFHVGGGITLPPESSEEASGPTVAAAEEQVPPGASQTDESGSSVEPHSSELPPTPTAVQPPGAGPVETTPPAGKKLRGSQRRRRSLRRGGTGSPPAEEVSGGVVEAAPSMPPSVDVFSQVPAVDVDELLAAATPQAPEPVAAGAKAEAGEVEAPQPPKPRPSPRPVMPTFETDPAGLAITGRPIVGGMLDPDEQAAIARLAAARRRRLRLVPLLLLVMAALIGGTVWAIYHFVPVIGRVEVSVRFRNIDGLPNEARRREFREQQRQRLASLPVRQAAIVNLAGYATPDMQVRPGFLEDPVEYDRVASGAQWVERGDWALRISRRGEDLRGDSWRLRAMGDALQQSNRALLDDARRLRADVERLDADISRNSARRGELRQLIEAERTLGDSKRQLEVELQKLESEIDALETRWAEQSRQVTALQSELALLRTSIPTAPAQDVASEAPADGELIALQKQLDQVHEAIQRSRAAGQRAATEARRSFEAAVARLQADLQDVQGTLGTSPELKAYLETAQGLLEVTRRLTDDLIHRQQQYYDRLQAFKSQLEEQARARRSEQWQGDPTLRRLQEELQYAKRQLNVATANGLEAEATDARLQIKLLEERIARRQQELGADPLAVSAILQLEEIIDFTAKAMAEDRVRQEKVFEENTRLLKQAAIARLPAEQQELARKLEARMAEINQARREFAAALSSETTQPAGNVEEIERLQQQAADIAARLEARRKQLADATAARLTQQQEQKRQEQIREKEAELASARLKVAELQEQLSVRHRDRREVARRVSEASLAGERLVQRQQELEEIEQLLEVWQRTRDAKQAELGACVEPLPVSDLDIQIEPGDDRRWVYASAAGGGLFILFGLLIAATVRAALHEIPVPDMPLRSVPLASRPGQPATVEPIEKQDEDARPAAT